MKISANKYKRLRPQTGNAMISVLLIVGIIIVVVIALLILKKFKPKAKKKSIGASHQVVEAVKLKAGDFNAPVNVFGVIRAREQASLSMEVGGKVIMVSPKFETGRVIKKGDLLLKIEDSSYAAALANARSNLADAELFLEQEKARSEKAERDWVQVGRGKKATALVLRKPFLKSAQAKVEAAKKALAKAEHDFASVSLRAPFDGRLAQADMEVGSFVAPGAPLANIFSHNRLELELSLSEQALRKAGLRPDSDFSKSDIFANFSYEGKSCKAKLVRSSGTFDARARSILLVAEIEDAGALAPGMTVEATLLGKKLSGAIAAPTTAAYTPNTILIIEPSAEIEGSGVIRFREIKVTATLRDKIIVSDGLKQGELVCVTPLNYVYDGMKVIIKSSDTGEDKE